jgi:hypothetical protein
MVVLSGCLYTNEIPPTPYQDLTEKVESNQFCFIDGYCLIKQDGVLYEDISGVNNTMPTDGTFYEVMYT